MRMAAIDPAVDDERRSTAVGVGHRRAAAAGHVDRRPRACRLLAATSNPSTRNGRRTSATTVSRPAIGGPNTNPAR